MPLTVQCHGSELNNSLVMVIGIVINAYGHGNVFFIVQEICSESTITSILIAMN